MSMPRKVRCTVESITDHGGRVYTVDLVPASSVPAFRPGQFLHLTVDDYDPASFWPESRVFSIASSPRDRRRLRLCYSVKGRYTAKMEQALAVDPAASPPDTLANQYAQRKAAWLLEHLDDLFLEPEP